MLKTLSAKWETLLEKLQNTIKSIKNYVPVINIVCIHILSSIFYSVH